jgi:TonB family protein
MHSSLRCLLLFAISILDAFALSIVVTTAAVPIFARITLSPPSGFWSTANVADDVDGLRDLSESFAEKLANHGVRKVFVLDFEEGDSLVGWPGPDGAWLANRFSEALSKAGEQFTVLDRHRYTQMLKGMPQNFGDRSPSFDPLTVGRSIGADTVVEGSYTLSGRKLSLTVAAFRVTGVIHCISIEVGMLELPTNFYDSMRERSDLTQPDTAGDEERRSTEAKNFTNPECIYCPMPSFRVDGPADEIRGVVLLAAIISPSGRATHMKVLKSLTPERDQQAIRAVENWTFKPATKVPGGAPFAMQVPIEVTFKPD